jgi:hypothetical protein
MLDRLLPLNGIQHVVKHLVVDWKFQSVPLGEAGDESFAVLVTTAGQVLVTPLYSEPSRRLVMMST